MLYIRMLTELLRVIWLTMRGRGAERCEPNLRVPLSGGGAVFDQADTRTLVVDRERVEHQVDWDESPLLARWAGA